MRLVAAVVLVVLLVASGIQVGVARADAFPSNGVFRVDGDVTTLHQFDQQAKVLSGLYNVQKPTDPRQLPGYHQAIAKALAVGDLLQHRAAGRGIVITDKAANEQLNQLIQQDFPTADGQSRFAGRLKALGISQDDVLAQIRQELAISQLFAKITANVAAATTVQAQSYYDANKAQIVSAEQRHLANIVVATQARAAQVLQQLQSGADFATLAQQDSLDGSTKDKGGDVGDVAASQLEPGYGKVAFAAPSGAFFGPVQTQFGWNVGQVISIMPSAALSFDQAQGQIKTAIQDTNKEQVWNGWIVKQLKAANVHYARAYRPAQPDSVPTSQTGQPGQPGQTGQGQAGQG